ncbi:hypothetical protein J8F10_12350 [Gemmata sp. G18]|uniref:Uncharacterized protein n=1 Tax=Gemmata palustris TaxID=2822762 RepID=A0ABS5BQV6_9BACT|nr:hypothetical protein [Gemmata palustris]MBP3956074.1 hypothetical protein [Gemmata palustris]
MHAPGGNLTFGNEFFSAGQIERLTELMARRRSARDHGAAFSAEEQTELNALIEAELVAATARSAKLLRDRDAVYGIIHSEGAPHAVHRVNNNLQPSWAETERLLLELQHRPATQVSLEADSNAFFVIEYVQGLGYYMSGCAPSDRDYFNLIESRLGDEAVEGRLVHEQYFFARYALVSQDVVLRAAKRFFEHGDRDPGCEWVPERDVTYD